MATLEGRVSPALEQGKHGLVTNGDFKQLVSMVRLIGQRLDQMDKRLDVIEKQLSDLVLWTHNQPRGVNF